MCYHCVGGNAKTLQPRVNFMKYIYLKRKCFSSQHLILSHNRGYKAGLPLYGKTYHLLAKRKLSVYAVAPSDSWYIQDIAVPLEKISTNRYNKICHSVTNIHKLSVGKLALHFRQKTYFLSVFLIKHTR